MLQRIANTIAPGLSLGGGAPATKQERGRPFKLNFGVLDGDAAFDTVAEVAAIIDAQAAGGIDELIWQLTVPAQQSIRFGFGTPQFQYNQGFMHFSALDLTVGFQEGILTLRQANARQTSIDVVLIMNSERLHTTDATTQASATPTDVNQMLAFPEKVEFDPMEQDDLVQMLYRTTLVTTTVSDVAFSLPVTVRQ